MRLNQTWILFIGKRYIQSKRNGRGITPSMLSIAGIAVGVMALVSVMSVMNGLQLGFIEDILEINSYHLRIEDPSPSVLEASRQLQGEDGIRAVVRFSDTQTLLQGEFSDYHSILVRGIDLTAARADRGLMEHLDMLQGSFHFDGSLSPGIIVGTQLARNLGLSLGDSVEMVSMKGGSFASLSPQHTRFEVSGIFKSGYYQYDSGLCFIDYGSIPLVESANSKKVIGIKIDNRFQDQQIHNRIEQIFQQEGISDSSYFVESWREYNRSFFNALRMEKLTMMLLLALIFLVVAVNIKGSLERSVVEKREEIGILRAIGAQPVSIRTIFLVEGGLIGSIGLAVGLIAGILISGNINEVFLLVEGLINAVLIFFQNLGSHFVSGGPVRIFSPQAFYLQEIPVRILYSDVLSISLFALISSLAAAYAASKRISEFSPAEILHNENE